MTNFWIWLAWLLPRDLAYWTFVRVATHAAVVHSDEEVPALTMVQCMKAWDVKVDDE